MKQRLFLTFFCVVLLTLSAYAQTPLRRSDSFVGLHFDFHAGMSDTHIGQTVTEAMIDSLLSQVKPDFIQIDCKGHPGVSSYPTKIGHKPVHFDKR
ncbi:MAG: hypothetical protein R2822_01095 [Spirosomataceae bacterium]